MEVEAYCVIYSQLQNSNSLDLIVWDVHTTQEKF